MLTIVNLMCLPIFLTLEILGKDLTAQGSRNTVTASRAKSSGRNRSDIWNQFTTKFENNKLTSNQCNICKKEVSPKATRMKEHFEKCVQKTQVLPMSTFASDQILAAGQTPSLEGPVTYKQPRITDYVTKITQQDKEKITTQVGRFVYSSNSPFNIVQNPEFKELLRLLNPSYHLPTHEVFGSTVLDKVYEEITNDQQLMLKDKKCVLLQDGWSTVQNEPVIAHCISTPEGIFFLNANPTEGNTKSADYCHDLFKEAKATAEEKFKVNVIGLVTDNASVMTKLQGLVMSENPRLSAYGCNAHLLNLVGQKYTDDTLQGNVVTIQTYFRNHQKAWALVSRFGGNRPVLPASTRWNSQIDCYKNLCVNQSKYLDAILALESDKNFDHGGARGKEKFASVAALVKNFQFFDDVRDAVSELEPIASCLDKVILCYMKL